jgi:hypothetical protein
VSAGYLWRNFVGGEFMADFTPHFQVQSAFVTPLADMPQVNSYMGNVIGAIPLGEDGQFLPFVSGGFGVMTLRTGTHTIGGTTANDVELLSHR